MKLLLEAVTSSAAVAAEDRIKAESSTASAWPATTKFSNQRRETTKNTFCTAENAIYESNVRELKLRASTKVLSAIFLDRRFQLLVL